MKEIVLYSPGLSTMNLGDKIITKSAKEEIDFILNNAFVTEIATHLPLSYYYMRHLKSADFRFVLGSNLLKSTFFGFKRQWNITLWLSRITGPCILVGAGWWQYNNKPNFYTKILLKSMLSKKYIHSVRDEYTEKTLKSIGIHNVINTACPTMWKLTKEHCSRIKKGKSNNVVFTLTDYKKHPELDRLFVNILCDNYNKVYYWPQGIGDYLYFNSLDIDNKKIIILEPRIKAFDSLLDSSDIEYVGTRLHGGIRALQKKIRTIIIAIDNRATEKNKSFNLPIVMREKLNNLSHKINQEFSTEIIIPTENIIKWKKQFKKNKKHDI